MPFVSNIRQQHRCSRELKSAYHVIEHEVLPLMQWASNNFPLIGTFEIAVVDVKAALNKCSEKRFDVRFVLDGFLFNLILKSNFLY